MMLLTEAFAEFDQDTDGFISKEDLSDIFSKFGHVVSSHELDTMIQLADVDGNGLIDFHEFSNVMSCYCSAHNGDEELENMFSMIDSNKDGYLSKKEIKNMMRNLGEKVRKKDVHKMVKVADLNKVRRAFQFFSLLH